LTDHSPVASLQMLIAIEAIVDRRYRGSPHEQHDTQIIKLDAKGSNFFAVISEKVEAALFQHNVRSNKPLATAHVAERRKQMATP